MTAQSIAALPRSRKLLTGLAGGFAMARAMTSLLYGVSPTDPVTYAAVAGLMLAIAVVASAVPAWRATRVDPIRTLKAE